MCQSPSFYHITCRYPRITPCFINTYRYQVLKIKYNTQTKRKCRNSLLKNGMHNPVVLDIPTKLGNNPHYLQNILINQNRKLKPMDSPALSSAFSSHWQPLTFSIITGLLRLDISQKHHHTIYGLLYLATFAKIKILKLTLTITHFCVPSHFSFSGMFYSLSFYSEHLHGGATSNIY